MDNDTGKKNTKFGCIMNNKFIKSFITICKNLNNLYIVGALIIIIMLVIMATTSMTKDRYKELSEIDKLMYSLNNFKNYNSFEIENKQETYSAYGTEDEDIAKTVANINFRKKDKNYKLEASMKIADSERYIGGLYLNSERIELITTQSESVFSRYKDMFSVIKTYVPTLEELLSDLESINYTKYMNIIKNDLKKYEKTANYNAYTKILKETLEGKITSTETEIIELDDKEIETQKYRIEMTAKESTKLEIDLLRKLQKDDNIRKLLTTIADDIFKELEEDEEYKKIRMTEDEFDSLKLRYDTNILSSFEEVIEARISLLTETYNMMSEAEKVRFDYNLSGDGKLLKVVSYGAYISESGILYIKSELNVKNINSIQSKEIVPNVKTRIDLAQQERAELFRTVQIIKDQYSHLLTDLLSDLTDLVS